MTVRETEKQKGKPKVKTKVRTHADAVLIRPNTAKTIASVLLDIRKEVNLEETGAIIRSIRQTRNGAVLIELDKETRNKVSFSDAVKATIWN